MAVQGKVWGALPRKEAGRSCSEGWAVFGARGSMAWGSMGLNEYSATIDYQKHNFVESYSRAVYRSYR